MKGLEKKSKSKPPFFYASSMGRFLKPDNVVPDLTNPQNWNGYSYVKGNPVNFNDPTGHGSNVRSFPTYIQGTHSFGMSWFDQFDSGWLPWAGQTEENSWYFGGTRSALSHYHNQYLKGLQKEKSVTAETPKTAYSTFPLIIFANWFSNSADIYELGKLLLEGGLIYAQLSAIQLAKDMMTLIKGLLFEGMGNYSMLNKGIQAWNEIKSLASEETPFNIDEKTRDNVQDSTYEIYRISQQEGLTFKELWNEYGMPWGGSDSGTMAIGFLEWYKKKFV